MNSTQENYGNRKEEILERSRNTIRDEGYENAKMRGINWGAAISAASVAVPLIIFSLFIRQYLVIFAILAMNGAFLAGRFFTLYRFAKNKENIFFTLCGVISAICAIASFVIWVVRGL